MRPHREIIKRDDGSIRVITHLSEETLVQQQYADECDINNIMAKYEAGQPITHVNRKVGHYGDFSGVTDFQGALDAITKAQNSFMELPPKIRNRFMNDPGQLLAFLNDPANLKEAIELGIVDGSPGKRDDELDNNANMQVSSTESKAKAKKAKGSEGQQAPE